MQDNNSASAEKLEKITNSIQFLSYINLPPQIRGTIGILSGHVGILGNTADLVEKIHNKKAKSQDFVDFIGSTSTIIGGIAAISKNKILENKMIFVGLASMAYSYLESINWDLKRAYDDAQNGFDEFQESVWEAIDYYNAVNYDDFKKDLNYSIDKMLEYFKSKSNKTSQISQLQTSNKNDKFINLQTSNSQQTPQLQNSQTSRHSEPLTCHSERSEESHKNLQNSQTSQNTLKRELTFTEKLLLKDFAHKLYGVKIPEIKQRIGIDAATQHKISFLLDTICEHKRQIVRNFGEKTWQETFENFQKTNDLKVFENAVKSQNSNENVNLKNTNLQNSAGNVNSENNITNPQENGNDFKM